MTVLGVLCLIFWAGHVAWTGHRQLTRAFDECDVEMRRHRTRLTWLRKASRR